MPQGGYKLKCQKIEIFIFAKSICQIRNVTTFVKQVLL